MSSVCCLQASLGGRQCCRWLCVRARGAANALVTFWKAMSAPYAKRRSLLVQINYPYIRRRRDFGKHAAFTASPVQVIASCFSLEQRHRQVLNTLHSAYHGIAGVSRNKDHVLDRRLEPTLHPLGGLPQHHECECIPNRPSSIGHLPVPVQTRLFSGAEPERCWPGPLDRQVALRAARCVKRRDWPAARTRVIAIDAAGLAPPIHAATV